MKTKFKTSANTWINCLTRSYQERVSIWLLFPSYSLPLTKYSPAIRSLLTLALTASKWRVFVFSYQVCECDYCPVTTQYYDPHVCSVTAFHVCPVTAFQDDWNNYRPLLTVLPCPTSRRLNATVMFWHRTKSSTYASEAILPTSKSIAFIH